MSNLIIYLLIAFSLTCLIEIVPLFFVKSNKIKWICSSVLCNFITNPLLNILLLLFSLIIVNDIVLYGLLITLEILAIAFEAFLYHNITDNSIKKCVTISAVCNCISFAFGLILENLIEKL